MTTKPTIKSLTRNGENITATWNIPKGGYDAQVWKRYPKADGTLTWGDERSIGKAVKTKTITFDRSDFYPYYSSGTTYKKKCDKIQFAVKGTKSKKASDWATISKTINPPPAAKIKRTVQSAFPSCKFEWSVAVDTKTWDKGIYSRSHITSVLVNNSETDGEKINWNEDHDGETKFGSTTQEHSTRRQWWSTDKSGSITITEDASLVGSGSWTRWFKVVPMGPAGYTKPVKYVNYTYSTPDSVSEEDTDVDTAEMAGGMSITVEYASQVSAAYPVEKYVINYMIATPNTGVQCPNWNSNGSFEVKNNATDGSGKYTLQIAEKPGADECLWVRVDAVHGTQTAIGEPKLVNWYNGKAGYLSAPTGLSVTPGTTASTISCTNASSVQDSYIVVRFYDDNHANGVDIAAFPVGTTSGTVTHPEIVGTGKFGVYAAVAADGTTGGATSSELVTETIYSASSTDAYTALYALYNNGASASLDNLARTIDSVCCDIVFEDGQLDGSYDRTSSALTYTTSESNDVTVVAVDSGQTVFRPYVINSGSQRDVSGNCDIKIWVNYYVDESDEPSYTANYAMQSAVTVQGGSIPTAPTGFAISKTDTSGMVRAEWDWSWSDATHAELSWADHPDAWMSTAEPETYTVARLYDPAWLIADLETGKAWYFRIRFLQVGDSTTTYGGYAAQKSIDLRTNPNVPIITDVEPASIVAGGEITIAWAYSSDDNTLQKTASVYEALGAGAYNLLATVGTAQFVTITAPDTWTNGTTHDLAVQVTSEGGRTSDYSEPATIVVAEPPTCTISASNLELVTFTSTDEDDEEITYTKAALTAMPLQLTITGAKAGEETTVIVERAGAYQEMRPDESAQGGFDGETIIVASHLGGDAFEFNLMDPEMIGRLDDGADYRIIAEVTDALGQKATAECLTLEDGTTTDNTLFTISWSHQPAAPTAEVSIVGTDAVLKPIAPANVAAGDTCDIYRLSADKPLLIIKGAIFGETYVDPYPTIWQGGYRFVTVSANGDYITGDGANGDPAWTDYEAFVKTHSHIIDFNGRQALLTLDAELSSNWTKEFRITKYLGGSVQGDWDKAVIRSSTLQVTVVPHEEMIDTIRDLVEYTGICHIRTKDGSNYSANVDASEKHNDATGVRRNDYTLQISRVDNQALEGITYGEWRATQPDPISVWIDGDTGELMYTVLDAYVGLISLEIDDDTGELIVQDNGLPVPTTFEIDDDTGELMFTETY